MQDPWDPYRIEDPESPPVPRPGRSRRNTADPIVTLDGQAVVPSPDPLDSILSSLFTWGARD